MSIPAIFLGRSACPHRAAKHGKLESLTQSLFARPIHNLTFMSTFAGILFAPARPVIP